MKHAFWMVLLAGSVYASSGASSAVAVFKGDGVTGEAELSQLEDGVLIRIYATGLTPGAHGFHIHETGTCTPPDFTSAGDHFNPHGLGHGFSGEGPHAGDMPNVVADSAGTVQAEVINPRISLHANEKDSLFDADGSALVIHEKADSYGKEAGAGGRVACAVIKAR